MRTLDSDDDECNGYPAVWADALCIDQSSTFEKNHQVAMMRTIYEKASHVVVWLGDADETCEKAFAFIKDMTKSGPECFGDAIASSFKGPNSLDDWDCICQFMRRSWFQRLFIALSKFGGNFTDWGYVAIVRQGEE